MDSPDDTACAAGCPIRTSEDHRALAPPLGFSQRATSFIASRCQGIHQMPFSCCARAQPRARGQGSVVRRQWSDNQPSSASRPRPRLGTAAQTSAPADARASAAHTHAQARSHPTSEMMGDDDRTCFTVTTRFTMSRIRRRRAAARPHGPPRRFAIATRWARMPEDADQRLCPPAAAFCPLRSPRLVGGPGPI